MPTTRKTDSMHGKKEKRNKPWSKTPPEVREARRRARLELGERHGVAASIRIITNNNRVEENEPPFAVTFEMEEGQHANLWFMRCAMCHTPLLMMWDRTHHYFAGCCIGCWNIQKIEDNPR